MVEPTMETLARRLDRVERENRWLKQAGVVALAVIAAVVLMGQATQGKVAKVVEAEKFVLRDEKGNIRGDLVVNGGIPSLNLYGEAKHNYAIVSPSLLSLVKKDVAFDVVLVKGEASLILRTGEWIEAQARLDVDADGSARITVGKPGRGKAVLGSVSLEAESTGVVEKRRESSLVFFGTAGKVLWSAP